MKRIWWVNLFVFTAVFFAILSADKIGASQGSGPCGKLSASVGRALVAASADIPADASLYVYFLVSKPAAGKGTYGRALAAALHIPYRSTGDALRAVVASGSELGQRIDPLMKKRVNILSEDVLQVLEAWLQNQNSSVGLVMDGSPRRLNEAMALDQSILAKGWKGIRVIYLDQEDELVFKKSLGRETCSSKTCGYPFHKDFRPTQKPGICDFCGSPLMTRDDDLNSEVVQQGIDTFKNDTLPVIEYFQSKGMLHRIDANQDFEEVWRQILAVLKS